MAKKSMKAAAAAGTSVFDQIASGNAQTMPAQLDTVDTQDTENAQDVHDTQDTSGAQYVQDVPQTQDTGSGKDGKEKQEPPRMERLNLKIPAEIKEYLVIASARASIEQRRYVSLTQYLCDLVAADAEKHKND